MSKYRTLDISGYKIGRNYRPFIVAELSGNHNQSLDQALKLIQLAAKSGVHAVKLQTYTPEIMTLDLNEREFIVKSKNSDWANRSLYDLYQEAHTPWDWHKDLFAEAKKHGLLIFSTPFDKTSVDFLESLNVPCYKIASFENTDTELLKYTASTGKPLIISTGLATISDLGETVSTIRNAGCNNFILLKCTSSYPASPKNSNILTIPHMQELFDCEIGISDHTMGIGVSLASISLGACFIEKHFTLSRAEGGIDSSFSLEPSEMQQLVVESRNAWDSLGKVMYEPSEEERNSIQFKRSLYIVSDLKKGEKLNEDNVRAIRPGLGLPPKFKSIVLGRKVLKNVVLGTALNWDIIE